MKNYNSSRIRLFGAVIIGCLFLLASVTVSAQMQGGFYPDLANGGYTNSGVSSFIILPDGKLVVASGRLFRLNPDGMRDSILSTDGEGTLELLPDGKFLHGLRYFSGSPSRVIRYNADGTVDASFNCPKDAASGLFGMITDIALAPDGDIYISDEWADGNVRVVRLNPDGSVDPGFARVTLGGQGGASDEAVEKMLVQPDGKLVLGGATTGSNLGNFDIFRVNPDGTLDTSFTAPDFGTGQFGNGTIFSIVRQGDGKLIVGGNFQINDGQNVRSWVLRLNVNGSIDSSFVIPNGYGVSGRAITLQPDGKILTAGGFIGPGLTFQTQAALIRLLPDGSLDSTFKAPIPSYPGENTNIAVAADGRIYLSGQNILIPYWGGSVDLLRVSYFAIARFSAEGRPEIPFAKHDYDGDERSDLAVFRPSEGKWFINTGQTISVYSWGVATDIPVAADFDGDAKTDAAVFRPSEGRWYVINSADFTLTTRNWGQEGDIPMGANKIWDRKAAFTVYRPSNRTWYRMEGTSSVINVVQFGAAGDIPLNGRYYCEPFMQCPAVYRPSTSTFLYRQLQFNAPTQQTQWGTPGDVPVVGDFDGDHITDLAVYTPASGKWSVKNSRDSSTFERMWGQPGDIPVVADYDADRRDDVAVYRPSTGQWFVWASTEGISVRTWGEPGDIPVPSAYLNGLQ